MKLYHGTNATAARSAITQGIQPRAVSRASNWKHTTESHPWLVYLTQIYSPYFAINAIRELPDEKFEHAAIIEIETDMLPARWFRPDEDFVAQVMVRQGKFTGTIKEATIKARKDIDQYSASWLQSVEFLANCAYKGTVPAHAITRVVTFDIKALDPMLAFTVLDAQVSMENRALMTAKYEAMTRWFMGEHVTAEEWLAAQCPKGSILTPEERFGDRLGEATEHWRRILANQPIRVLHHTPQVAA